MHRTESVSAPVLDGTCKSLHAAQLSGRSRPLGFLLDSVPWQWLWEWNRMPTCVEGPYVHQNASIVVYAASRTGLGCWPRSFSRQWTVHTDRPSIASVERELLSSSATMHEFSTL